MQLPADLLQVVFLAGALARITPPNLPLDRTDDEALDQLLAQLRVGLDDPERRPDLDLAAQQLRRLATGAWVGPLVYTVVEGGAIRAETLCEAHARQLATQDGLLVEGAYHLRPGPSCERCALSDSGGTGADLRSAPDLGAEPAGRFGRGQAARVESPGHPLDGRGVRVVIAIPVEPGQCVRYTVQPEDGDEYDREVVRHGELAPIGVARGAMRPTCRPCPCGSGVDWSVCPGPEEG